MVRFFVPAACILEGRAVLNMLVEAGCRQIFVFACSRSLGCIKGRTVVYVVKTEWRSG